MTPSDPSGLLKRMPELERIAAEDGPVRAALAEGIAPAEKERSQKLVRQDAKLSGFVISALDHWPQ